MGFNFYLSYDHIEEHGGETFYYLRCGLFHGSGLTDLLLLLSDLDAVSLLALPGAIPHFIASGTKIQSFSGGAPYVVPEDLHLVLVENGIAGAPVYDPTQFLAQGLANQPIAVYCGTAEHYPTGFSPADKVPNVLAYPNWYVPDLSTRIITIASRKSSSPFWTRGIFEYFGAYGSGPYNCEGLPYNIHVTCNPSEMQEWDAPTNYRLEGVWQVNGYFRDIQSTETMYLGFPLVYTSATISYLEGQLYAPDDPDDPVVYFPLVGVPGNFPIGILPALLTIEALLPNLLGKYARLLNKRPRLSAREQTYGLQSNGIGLQSDGIGLATK